MKKLYFKIALYVLLALSPLLYFQFREYLPSYSRRPLVYEMLFFIPYILFFVTAFLGLKLNQSRIFFTSVLWTILYYLLNSSDFFGAKENTDEVQLVKLLALSSPYILFLLYGYSEKYIMGLYGLLRTISVLVPVAGALFLAKGFTVGKYPYLLGNPLFDFDFWRLPDIIFLFIGGLTAFLVFQKDKSIQFFKKAIYINLLPLMLSFNFAAGRGQFDFESSLFNLFSFSVMGLIFLYALYRTYWEKVYIDELTGIPNRRAFDEYLKKLGRKYVIAMIDIDHFKSFNDTYGHTEGDNVLRYVAKHIEDEAGAHVFRYGGEEFAAIYKGLHIKHALPDLDKMRAKLAATIFYLRSSDDIRMSKTKKNRQKTHSRTKSVKVTISVGIAQKIKTKKGEPHDVMIKADKALYKAKENGRNRCEKTLA